MALQSIFSNSSTNLALNADTSRNADVSAGQTGDKPQAKTDSQPPLKGLSKDAQNKAWEQIDKKYTTAKQAGNNVSPRLMAGLPYEKEFNQHKALQQNYGRAMQSIRSVIANTMQSRGGNVTAIEQTTNSVVGMILGRHGIDSLTNSYVVQYVVMQHLAVKAKDMTGPQYLAYLQDLSLEKKQNP
jgi:hypothetical protein